MTYTTRKDAIFKLAEDIYGIPNEALIESTSRQQRAVQQRKLICYLLREHLALSYPAIAREIGREDHTTAMHHVKSFDVEKFRTDHPGALEILNRRIHSTRS